MSKKITFICELANGVHARPASHIERVCKLFNASIYWHNLRADIKVDAKSVLALISSNTLSGDDCHLIIDGEDEDNAFITLKKFIEYDFPICDEQVAASQIDDSVLPLPRSLSNLNPDTIRVRAVCGGVAHGKLQFIRHTDLYSINDFPIAKLPEEELKSAKSALKTLKGLLIAQINYVQDTAKEILIAHEAIIDDPAFLDQIELFIHQGNCVGLAIINTAKFFSEQLSLSGSEYLKERELDIRDICLQLLQQIYGDNKFKSQSMLSEPTICMAEELTPSQFLELDKQHLKGLLLQHGGTTSHTVILARSFNIPTLVGVPLNHLQEYQGKIVQIDGNLGLVAFNLTKAVSRYYQLEEQLQCQLIEKQQHLEVEHLSAKFRMNQGDVTLLSNECVIINPDWQSKEEVIKGMTDKLLVNERCRYPRKLENDLWDREDIFSTALGHGFAIPHTKSEHIEQSTISVAKLPKYIKWGEEDVNLVIMLTLNKHSSGDQHMRIFSKLARKIMHESFREQLKNANNSEEVIRILTQELEL